MLEKGRLNIEKQLPLSSLGEKEALLTIALSVIVAEYPEKFELARKNEFALEYTPDPLLPEMIRVHVEPYIQTGIPVRYHTRFFDYELGNEDPDKAAEALLIHKNVIDEIVGYGEQVVTVHLNLNKSTPFNTRTAVNNLKELSKYAKEKGIALCLENLKKGPTSYPENVIDWAEEADTMITMDLGHAISSDYVCSGNITVEEMVSMFKPRLHEVHMYAKEEDRHYPITDITGMTSIIDSLLTTECRWWTIELDDINEAFDTRKKILDYLNIM